jgi:hypothetical protein
LIRAGIIGNHGEYEARAEDSMKAYLSVLLLSLTVLSTSALAQYGAHQGTPQQQRACRPDVVKYCRGIQGDYAIVSCLQANMPRLSAACRRVFGGQ